ncbi:cob(I)yrinic acid a,c-diamide adenosyltransferase [Fontisphaera persica]|uniref:cob(I)yrinic acid a,c-diamide adenosyltransferase n=1 Tax=Fontisphaera persica TaxID=2974023 RepID=UPI0024BFDEEA|nr:cob(I)yrinic acid a,c-diamide adenosyltransferase [Fontisphaera persica]WCJ58275.1 cob(I)yrinic acid a,c-diamide adenosyltransferase [Fontisphaera persica]
MSVVTKKGDGGQTALMYNRCVPKNHPRVEAYGSVDELNAALGLARATAAERFIQEVLLGVQQDLIAVMGELATLPEDLERYHGEGYPRVTPEMTARLEAWVKQIEAQKISFKGWATPGANLNAAALDVARTVCRRAERRVCDLAESQQLPNAEILIFLNRLGDLLWLLARWNETQAAAEGQAMA